MVIHSHAHGDHVAADPQFQAMPGVQLIAATPSEISKATGIANWPTDLGKIDLGNRVIDVVLIPGHNEASIALYDRLTGNLMTGDSLYPGRLGVQDFAAFKASAQRLADFVSDRPIAHVLGTHIETDQHTLSRLSAWHAPTNRRNTRWLLRAPMSSS